MLINEGEAIYLDADGKIADRAADGGTLLVAAGGPIDEVTATKYAITGRLTPQGDIEHTNPVTGEPLVLVNGRAYAKDLIAPPVPKAVRAESKMIAGPAENKAAVGPGPAPAPALQAANVARPADKK